jgi:hypothetical protein
LRIGSQIAAPSPAMADRTQGLCVAQPNGPDMSLQIKIKTALDETRLLILGSQILFGFQFHGVFQDSFAQLSVQVRYVHCFGLFLMMTTIGLLIAPAMQHRIVEGGQDSIRIYRATTKLAGIALLPFGISLGLVVFVVFEQMFGRAAGVIVGAMFCLAAGVFWYGLEFVLARYWKIAMEKPEKEKETPLAVKIEQMLTEARVVLPGAQALLGFQFTVILTHSFDQLPYTFKVVHAIALSCVALTVILLMAPAAFHRIAFAGEDTEDFHRLGSTLIVAATCPLAIGIAADVYVAISKATGSPLIGAGASGAAVAILLSLWYIQPALLRRGPLGAAWRRWHTSIPAPKRASGERSRR